MKKGIILSIMMMFMLMLVGCIDADITLDIDKDGTGRMIIEMVAPDEMMNKLTQEEIAALEKEYEKVEIIDKLKVKLRTNGIGMDEYSVGNFNVEGYGKCKLYIYNDVKPYILIESDNEQIFINGEDNEDTLRYYDEIIAVINKK